MAPIYDYSCEKCQTCIEVMKRITETDREEKCEVCGTVMHREISTGIKAKYVGDGFSATDMDRRKKWPVDLDIKEKKLSGKHKWETFK